MASLKITVLSSQNEVRGTASGENELLLVWEGEYQPGDKIRFETDEVPGFYVVRVDGAMDEAYVYMTRERVDYTIPFAEKKVSYNPVSFTGPAHYITIRRAGAEENRNYRNLAKNVMDQQDAQGCYPHASANVETRGESVFAARNAIDGCYANDCHGAWPYQSWGINRDPEAALRLDFGRPVRLDRLVFTLRADFPHDSWWNRCTVRFSDGSRLEPEFAKTGERQVFELEARTVEWLVVEKLIKDPDDPSPFPALTQLEAWGTEAP